MVNITFLEVHLDGASFSADRPFGTVFGSESDGAAAVDGGANDGDTEGDQPEMPDWSGDSDADEKSGVPTKPLAVLGVLLVLVGTAAVVRYLSGEEDPDVAIETPEGDEYRPVGVAVDE